MSRHLLRTLLALLLSLAAATGAGATQRALLVGVSELVNQPQTLWLQAPRNDVMLMRQALLKQGFAPADITVLADGVAGAALPEAARIHEALAQLLAQSRSGDFVMLYFSGHGTRLRDATKRYQEPDGLAENFLARDVRGAVGADQPLSGGVRDVDFDGWVQAFLARNVFVWSVFDTCSATSMTRGVGEGKVLATAEGPQDDEVRWRGLRAVQLRASAAEAPLASRVVPPAAESVARARYVAFFASESHQVTPELRLPRKGRGARPQGLLTWAVADALERRPATWRELFDEVLALYPPVIDELAQRFPTRELPSPVAEGNLDTALFANSTAAVSTRPVWRAQRTGAQLTLAAGQLDGLVTMQGVRVLATLDDGTVRSAAGQLAQVELGSARIALPAELRDLTNAAHWSASPMAEPTALALRVASDRGLPAGLSLDYPASVIAAATPAQADVRWTDLGAAGVRLDILSPDLGGLGAAGQIVEPGVARRRIEALARLKWFARLQSVAKDAQFEGFEAQFEVWNGDRMVRADTPQRAAGNLLPLRAGERAVVGVRNTTGQSVNLVIVGVDAQGTVRPVYPGDQGETNRFERGSREQPAAKRFELPWFDSAGARLLVLATPASAHSAPRLFGAGPAEPIADLRVRGIGTRGTEADRQVFAAMVRWGG